MERPIVDGGGDRVAEHLPPPADRPVAGDRHARALAAP
jgi:hypothetical protein